VTALRVILMSDTHLSPAAPEAQANWEAVLRYVDTAVPDLVIHLGDLALDGAHDPGDLSHGRQQLDRLPVPWHAEQWSWLERQVSDCAANQPLALITHKPVVSTDADMAISPPYRFLPPASRDRLAGLFRGRPLALVMSGHVHQYRLLRLDGTDHLWAPTTWAVLPDEAQPVFGAKRCGIVSLDLVGDTPPQPEFVAPDGIAQLTMTRDLPDPYHH